MTDWIDEHCVIGDLDEAGDAVDGLIWPDYDREDLIGLEVEAFPIVTESGSRLTLHGPDGGIETVRTGLRSPSMTQPPQAPVFSSGEGGGCFTFEPGGQIELSTSARRDTGSLQTELDRTWDTLQDVFGERGVALVSLGLDPWHRVEEVPQQLRAGRYVAMDRYFSTRWPAGAVMMRNTCALQVNIDAGSGRNREQRWLVANLMSPLLTAMFATSPCRGHISSGRAKVWQAIDPTRTGHPRWPGPGSPDAYEDARTRALRANVMFVSRDGSATQLEPDFSFEDWVRSGHDDFGRPTLEDLRTHLSTVFTEVRPRGGTLELRSVDALPRRWWMVPVVVAATVLYDEGTRGQVIDLLSPMTARLDQVWQKAAVSGLQDPEVADAAGKLARIVLDTSKSCHRLDMESVGVAEEYFERFTLQCRAPADELREVLTGDVRNDLTYAMGL